MADGNITVVLEKLAKLAVQEASLLGKVEGQVRLLRNEMEWMRVLLEDGDVDENSNRDKRLQLLVNQTRDVSYDAEDVVDEFMFEIQSRPQSRVKVVEKFLPRCVRFAHKLPFIHELDDRIRDINMRVEKILANKDRYKIEAGSSTSSEGIAVRREKRVPAVEEVDVVGMVKETGDVMQKLVEGDSKREVVAIVGMGGLGKTTLAKKVYSRVKDQFGCCAWVYVSQQYTIRELLTVIANSIMTHLKPEEKAENSGKTESDLGSEVEEYLKARSYFIVLDDVWSKEAWGDLSLYLPESNKRSRVLITTRDKQIALDAQAQPCELKCLSKTKSWELFCKKACPTEELKDLGKKITEKCDGLPLAIVVIGGLLSRKEKTEHSWKKIYESMEWHLKQGPDSCMGILALSYNNLPYFLKSCFLYCGIFPEDYEIKASKLMQMWIAEGFVQGRDKETVEDVAEDYLEELIERSMIQVERRGWDGIRIKSSHP